MNVAETNFPCFVLRKDGKQLASFFHISVKSTTEWHECPHLKAEEFQAHSPFSAISTMAIYWVPAECEALCWCLLIPQENQVPTEFWSILETFLAVTLGVGWFVDWHLWLWLFSVFTVWPLLSFLRGPTEPCTITVPRMKTRSPSGTATTSSTCSPSTMAGCTAPCRELGKPGCSQRITLSLLINYFSLPFELSSNVY